MRKFTQTWQTNWSKKLNKYAPVLAVAVVFGGFGTAFLFTSHAATPVASVETENGTVSSAAGRVTDSTASGASAVKFGSGSGGGGTCANTTNYPAGFPNNCTTGVPAGTTLTTYTGPSVITSCGTTIDSKTVNDLTIQVGNGTHSASTPCVTIKNSKVNGVIFISGTNPDSYGPLVMTDVEVSAPNSTDQSTVYGSNYYLTRVNVHGGGHGAIQCYGYCTVSDSWTHDFFLAGATHYDGIGSNSTDGDAMVLDHNSIACNFSNPDASGATGGCSADLGLFGDFGPISYVTVNNNLFVASLEPSYCIDSNGYKAGKAYPTGDHLVFTNNVFQKGSNGNCGQYGPVADWADGNGNVWTGNKWDDGTALNE